MTTHLALQRILLPSAQVSSLTTGSITLPSARGAFAEPTSFDALVYYEVPSNTSSVTLSSIPTTYQHIDIYVLGSTNRTTYTNDTFIVSFNGTGASRSSWIGYDGVARPYYYGTGGGFYGISAGASANYNASAVGGGIMRVSDYASSNKGKVWHSLTGFATDNTSSATHGQANINGGFVNTTSPISSITFSPGTGSNILAGTKFWLYGIKAS